MHNLSFIFHCSFYHLSFNFTQHRKIFVHQDEPLKEEDLIPVVDNMDEINEIDEYNEETNDAFAAYLAEGSQKDREVVFSRELGLGKSLEFMKNDEKNIKVVRYTLKIDFDRMVGDYINIIKTIFLFKFYLLTSFLVQK